MNSCRRSRRSPAASFVLSSAGSIHITTYRRRSSTSNRSPPPWRHPRELVHVAAVPPRVPPGARWRERWQPVTGDATGALRGSAGMSRLELVFELAQSTSASSLLLSSIDAARRQFERDGEALLGRALDRAERLQAAV